MDREGGKKGEWGNAESESFSISSPFPLSLSISSSFPRSPAARLQRFVQPWPGHLAIWRCSRWHFFVSSEWPHIAALSASSHPINHCQVYVTIIIASLLLISWATLELLTAQPITSKIGPQSFPWTRVCLFSQFVFDQACHWFRALSHISPQQSLMTLSSIPKAQYLSNALQIVPFLPLKWM